jgi:hypothetical protein
MLHSLKSLGRKTEKKKRKHKIYLVGNIRSKTSDRSKIKNLDKADHNMFCLKLTRLGPIKKELDEEPVPP